MSSSEVTQLRSRIATEIQAMNRALYGYAEVARHQIIDQKYCQLGSYQDQLTKILGQREAIEVMIEEFNAYAKIYLHRPPLKKADTRIILTR